MSKKGGRRGHLSKALDSHIQNIQETFQMLNKPASSSLDKVNWTEVVKLGDEVSKQATIAGMLWNGEAREVKELEQNMEAYFNMLQGFLLTCHGSTVNAGPTLHKSIYSSAKRVMDSSLSLLREAVSFYDSRNPSERLTIPQLSGLVWEACSALKMNPTTNCTAIVRAIAQVAVSAKDVFREMKELKTTSHTDAENQEEIDDILSDDGLGEDLSTEEMIIVKLVINVTDTSLNAFKEIIRFLSGLLKNPKLELDTKDFVEVLERLLSCCKEIGLKVSELGACVYPPQEISEMRMIAMKIAHAVGEIRGDVESLESAKEKLFIAFQELETALEKLDSGLDGDLESNMDRLAFK